MRLLHALLAKTSAHGLALAGLEAWIGFADDVEGATALHDLAVGVAALH